MANYTVELIGRGPMADRDAVEIRLRCARDDTYFQFFRVMISGIALATIRREHGDVPETWWRAAVDVACAEIRSMVTMDFRPLEPPNKAFSIELDLRRVDDLHAAGGLPAASDGGVVSEFEGP